MKRSLSVFLIVCLLLCAALPGAAAADKVFSLTLGVHKYAANNTPSDGASIATVSYTRLKDGSTGSENHLYNVQPGEQFVLTTAVQESQAEYYAFWGWFDGSGALLSTDEALTVTMDASKAVFAAYVEIADRHILTYAVTKGEGSLSVSSDRTIFGGDGCASVLHGANATVTIKPAKDYSVYVMKVNGQKVSMLSYTARTFSAAVQSGSVKGAFNALVNFVKFLIGKEARYTIENITADCTFEVGLMKPAF